MLHFSHGLWFGKNDAGHLLGWRATDSSNLCKVLQLEVVIMACVVIPVVITVCLVFTEGDSNGVNHVVHPASLLSFPGCW